MLFKKKTGRVGTIRGNRRGNPKDIMKKKLENDKLSGKEKVRY